MEHSFPPTFRTARLRFDALVDADAAGIHAIRRLKEVMKWSLKKVPDADLATTRKWVEEYLRPEPRVPGNVGYVIREIEPVSGSSAAVGGVDGDGKGRIIASIGLRYGFVEALGGKRWELGYIFHPDFWGKGITWGEEQQERSEEVVAITDKGNEPSMRVLRKCGFEAVEVEEFLDKAGTPCVAFVYKS
ncbi:hypothetical protein KXW46_007357 [Aspergillus fumigatus]|nr:hypothetical protein KXW46_007357 [Aspergillus fumigatus]